MALIFIIGQEGQEPWGMSPSSESARITNIP